MRTSLVHRNYLNCRKFGQVMFYWIIQSHFAFIYQDHKCSCGNRFRHRGNPENCVWLHRLTQRNIRKSHRFEVENLMVVSNEHNGARHRMAIDKRLQGGGKTVSGGVSATRAAL